MLKRNTPEHDDEFHQRAIEAFENEGGPSPEIALEEQKPKHPNQEKKRKKSRVKRNKTEK